jgi:aspartate aminotransferase
VDALAIREFDKRGKDQIPTMLVCQSYAKNMGLYGERVGALAIVAATAESAGNVLKNITTRVIRPMYSSPPLHGARLATLLLTDPELNSEWRAELKLMADRIISMRQLLVAALVERGEPLAKWKHIQDQIGMFAFTGLTPTQVQSLLDDHGIYLTKDGRMSMAGM